MNIGVGPVVKTHGFSYLPVPVGAGTIAPAVPDTQNKPRGGSEPDGKQLPLSCFTIGPAAYIEKSEGGMEYKEENIEKGQPHGYKDRQVVKLVSHKDTKGTDELATPACR